MRLRLVTTCNFQRSELTNFLTVLEKHPELADGKIKLRLEDVVLLVSKTGNQLVFLHGFESFLDEDVKKIERKVLRSTKFRLPNKQSWNPLMLVNYAKTVGIALTGLKEYEDHVRALVEK